MKKQKTLPLRTQQKECEFMEEVLQQVGHVDIDEKNIIISLLYDGFNESEAARKVLNLRERDQ